MRVGGPVFGAAVALASVASLRVCLSSPKQAHATALSNSAVASCPLAEVPTREGVSSLRNCLYNAEKPGQ